MIHFFVALKQFFSSKFFTAVCAFERSALHACCTSSGHCYIIEIDTLKLAYGIIRLSASYYFFGLDFFFAAILSIKQRGCYYYFWYLILKLVQPGI